MSALEDIGKRGLLTGVAVLLAAGFLLIKALVSSGQIKVPNLLKSTEENDGPEV